MSNGNTPKNFIEKEDSLTNPPDDSLNDSENEVKQVLAVTSKFDDKLRKNIEHSRDKHEPSGSRKANQQESIPSRTKTEVAQRETCTKLLPNQKAILPQRETCTKLLPHSNKKNNATLLDFTPTSNETRVKTVPSPSERESSEIQKGETITKSEKFLPIFQVNQKDIFKATHPKIKDMSSVKIIKAGTIYDQIKLQKNEENRSNYDSTKEKLAGSSELQRYLLSKMAKLQGANIGVAISPQGERIKSPYGTKENKQIDKLTFRDLIENAESIEVATTRVGLINNEYQSMETDFSYFKGEKDMQRTDYTSFDREKQKQKHGCTDTQIHRKSQNTPAWKNKIVDKMKDVHDDLEITEPFQQIEVSGDEMMNPESYIIRTILEDMPEPYKLFDFSKLAKQQDNQRLEIILLTKTPISDISDFNLFNGSKNNEVLIETDFIDESRSGCVPECGKDPTKYFKADGPIEIEKESTYYLASIKEITDMSEISQKSILIIENKGTVIEELFVEETVKITFEIATIRKALNMEQQKQLGVAFEPKEGILIETHYARPPPPFHDPPRHYIAKVATLAEYDYIYEKVHKEKKIKKTEIHRVHLTKSKGETQHSQQFVTKDKTMKYINRGENMEQDKNSAGFKI